MVTGTVLQSKGVHTRWLEQLSSSSLGRMPTSEAADGSTNVAFAECAVKMSAICATYITSACTCNTQSIAACWVQILRLYQLAGCYHPEDSSLLDIDQFSQQVRGKATLGQVDAAHRAGLPQIESGMTALGDETHRRIESGCRCHQDPAARINLLRSPPGVYVGTQGAGRSLDCFWHPRRARCEDDVQCSV